MGVGLTMLRDGKADALVSAGSTGALLTGATLITKRCAVSAASGNGPPLSRRQRGAPC